MAKVMAWYFSDETKKLRYGDGRETALGITHEVDELPVLCKCGLHGSKRLIDAIKYAPSAIVWRVELSGKMDISDDKIAAQKRRYVSGGIDISDTLREFARKQALSVAHLWDMPDIVREWLETGDETKRLAAESAAESAARSAASPAASSAARSAARSAAELAAWSAAWLAAWFVAESAARSAASPAARSAAWSAVWSAAWSAVDSAAEKMLVKMVEKAIATKKEQ